MTLFDRLKPEVRRKLDDIEYQFPAVYKDVKENLDKYSFWTDVPFCTVLDFRTYLKVQLDDFASQFETPKQ